MSSVGEATGMPQRLGAIDCGSNAIRMSIAHAHGPGSLAPVASERVLVRLGKDAFTRGELDGPTIDLTVATFAQFRTLFDQHGVERYRAVATSAVRSAHNREVLVHRLYHEAGIELDVIDGDEEARLVRKAVLNALVTQPPPRMVVDLGGGSLEISIHDGSQWQSCSLPVGTVRLIEIFGLTDVIGQVEAGMIRHYTATLLQSVPAWEPFDLGPGAVCGGNAETLARLFGNVDGSGMPGMDLDALEHALPGILETSIEERMARFAVRRDRAEVMGVAALVLATVCRRLQIPRLLAPGVGIRDGLLLELAQAMAAKEGDADWPMRSIPSTSGSSRACS